MVKLSLSVAFTFYIFVWFATFRNISDLIQENNLVRMNGFSQSECPGRLPLSQAAIMEQLAKPKSASVRGKGKGRKRSLVRPPSMPDLSQSFFGSFDDFEDSQLFKFPQELLPSQAKRTVVSLARRKTMANIEEVRSDSHQQEELSVADFAEQLQRVEENSHLMATEGFPHLVLEVVNKVGANFKSLTQTRRERIGRVRQAVQEMLEAGLTSRADLGRKYRELEDLEEEYRAVRARQRN